MTEFGSVEGDDLKRIEVKRYSGGIERGPITQLAIMPTTSEGYIELDKQATKDLILKLVDSLIV